MHKIPITLRIATDTDNSTYFTDDPLRTLLFGFKTEFIYVPNLWDIGVDNSRHEGKWTKWVHIIFKTDMSPAEMVECHISTFSLISELFCPRPCIEQNAAYQLLRNGTIDTLNVNAWLFTCFIKSIFAIFQ